MLALIAVLAVVAVFATGRSGGDGSDAGLAQTRPVQVTGSPLPTHSEGAQDPAVGMAAPVLRGASVDGTPVTIGGDGKATLVVFVAHWCPHCQRELPVLASWLEDGRLPSSVSLSVVSTAASQKRPNSPPSAWLRDAGLNVPVLADDEQSSAATAYGLSAFPVVVRRRRRQGGRAPQRRADARPARPARRPSWRPCASPPRRRLGDPRSLRACCSHRTAR